MATQASIDITAPGLNVEQFAAFYCPSLPAYVDKVPLRWLQYAYVTTFLHHTIFFFFSLFCNTLSPWCTFSLQRWTNPMFILAMHQRNSNDPDPFIILFDLFYLLFFMHLVAAYKMHERSSEKNRLFLQFRLWLYCNCRIHIGAVLVPVKLKTISSYSTLSTSFAIPYDFNYIKFVSVCVSRRSV